MFAILHIMDYNSLIRTLHSFHLIRNAVHKEECDGYRRSVPAIESIKM